MTVYEKAVLHFGFFRVLRKFVFNFFCVCRDVVHELHY